MMLHQLLLPLNKDYRFLIENNYFLLLFSPHGFCQCNSSPILFSFFFFLWSSNVFLFPPSVSLCGYWEDTHSAASKGRCQWVAIHQVCVCVCVWLVCVVMNVSNSLEPLFQDLWPQRGDNINIPVLNSLHLHLVHYSQSLLRYNSPWVLMYLSRLHGKREIQLKLCSVIYIIVESENRTASSSVCFHSFKFFT